MKIGIAQINTTVGNLLENAALILTSYRELVAQGAELVMTPELALTGYPPLDLIFSGEFVDRNLVALADLHEAVSNIGEVPLVVGFIVGEKFQRLCIRDSYQPMMSLTKGDTLSLVPPPLPSKWQENCLESRFAKISGHQNICQALSISSIHPLI
jgi:hypothetical protein